MATAHSCQVLFVSQTESPFSVKEATTVQREDTSLELGRREKEERRREKGRKLGLLVHSFKVRGQRNLGRVQSCLIYPFFRHQ